MAKAKPPFTEFWRTLNQRMATNHVAPQAASWDKRSISLRWYLILLVIGTLLPVAVFATAVVYQLSNQEQAASERRLLLAARNLSAVVENELTSTTRILQALSASKSLSAGDLKTFHGEAKRVVKTQPTWLTVILLSPAGQPMINTRRPFGQPLAAATEPESVQQVIATRQPTVGYVAPAKAQPHLLGVPVRIPVMRGNELQYVLTAVINQKAIAKVVNEQTTIDGEWTRTVVDGRGVVVARTRDPERFVGRPGTHSFLKRIRETTEGVYRDTTLEGVQVYVAFHRVGYSPWTVAVTVPVDVIQGPSRQVIGLVVSSGLALLFTSVLGAFVLSRRISHSITSVAVAAEALAKGDPPRVSPLPIREVVLLGQSLEFAADLLSQREQERTENLRRAEAAREEAEIAREEAEAANRIKDEFLSVLSHELRTPLNPILGWSQLLRRGKLDAAKTTYALETIERNAQLQTQLIEDLLDVARIMRGKLSLNMTPVNLASIIAATIETMQLAAEAKSIQLKTILTPLPGQILGDSVRLQQVLWNLLSNAIKFTPEGGQVKIQLQDVDTQAQIQISDTGKGIHPNFLPHVFEYFRQEDGKTTRKYGGLGLGLAIVRHLVELHGGTVQVDSPGEEQGATFTVRLPLIRDEVSVTSSNSRGSSLSKLHATCLMNLRVLVVDDDTDTRDFVAFTLEQYQAKVTAVASAQNALTILAQTPFDLLISDIGMPEMNGYTLMQEIRRRAYPLLAIALTAYAEDYNQQQALHVGFQRHIAKPVEPETLVSAIVDLVTTHAELQS